MCSRYSLTSPHEAVRSYFGYGNDHPFPPRYNIAPTQPVAIVRPGGRFDRELVLVRWGLIPSWAKDLSKFSTLINARAETAAEKPSFRGAMRHKRCLVPASGFYEWTGAKGAKKPYLIQRSGYAPGDPAAEPLAFAGLFEDWLGPDGSEIFSMAILTVPANDDVARIHDRMPAILAPDQFEAWLNCHDVPVQEAAGLLRPAPVGTVTLTSVSTKVNNPRTDGPEVLEPDDPTLL